MRGRVRQLRLAPVASSGDAVHARRELAAAGIGPFEPGPITRTGIEFLT